jgi:hypothetical protein
VRPNGLEMSRPATQDKYRAKSKLWAGRVGSIELLGVRDAPSKPVHDCRVCKRNVCYTEC